MERLYSGAYVVVVPPVLEETGGIVTVTVPSSLIVRVSELSKIVGDEDDGDIEHMGVAILRADIRVGTTRYSEDEYGTMPLMTIINSKELEGAAITLVVVFELVRVVFAMYDPTAATGIPNPFIAIENNCDPKMLSI